MVAAWRTSKAKDRAIIGMLCVVVAGLLSLNVAMATTLRHAKNLSFPSQCVEEDNVNIPIYGGYVSDYQITATFPTYFPLTTDLLTSHGIVKTSAFVPTDSDVRLCCG